jgi:acyl carrier protein
MTVVLQDDVQLALRLIIFGGEALELAALAPWFARYGDVSPRLVNMYGITETTVHVTWCPLSARDLDTTASWIGRPLEDLELFLLDASGRPVPIGAPGEIYIGGGGVARGYLNRPELTAERFVQYDIFGKARRLYRSGDLARYRDDGSLDYLGRIDEQVKVRGFRIELGEIEATLARHPQVRQAVVTSHGAGARRTLIAYLLTDSATIDISKLRNWLMAHLPDYMVPARLVQVESLTLTPNGKIDRRALPIPTEAIRPQTVDSAVPRDATEQLLVDIWREVLGIAAGGIRDNFFELGGHSLTAVQVVSRIHQVCGIRLPLRTLFDNPTIEALAPIITAGTVTARAAILRSPLASDYPLSHAQQRLWLDHQAAGQQNYNMPEALLFETHLDRDQLQRVFITIIERHEILRTAFLVINGELRQRVLDRLDFRIDEIDLTDASQNLGLVQAFIDKQACTPFDLEVPPLFRVTLIRGPDGRQTAVMVMHHIVGDGWSHDVLHREIATLYKAFQQGLPDPLPPLRIQYKDFAVWEAARDFEREERYWLSTLADAPVHIALPYDHLQPIDDRLRGGRLSLLLEPPIAQGLRDLATRRNTSISNVVLALFEFLLFRVTSQEDICIGLAVANRPYAELEELLGCFVNVVPIRIRLSGYMEFDELVDQVAERVVEAIEAQSYPFDVLVSRLDRSSSPANRRFLEVIYAYQGGARVSVGMDTSQLANLPRPTDSLDFAFGFVKAELCLIVADHGERGLGLTLEYDQSLFRPATVERYLNTMKEFALAVAG